MVDFYSIIGLWLWFVGIYILLGLLFYFFVKGFIWFIFFLVWFKYWLNCSEYIYNFVFILLYVYIGCKGSFYVIVVILKLLVLLL